MPSDAYREARAATKEARAAAKEARHRWLRLRPWYFKKRYVLGIPVLLALAAAFAFLAISLERGDDASDTRRSEATAAAALGSVVRVGSIDLTLVAFEPFDGRPFSPANDVTHRLRFRAAKVRGPAGEAYRLVDDAFHPLDAARATHEEWRAACQNCPDALGSGVPLALDASIEGVVYFRIPEGHAAVELEYRAPGSTDTGRFALR